jgi:hypothetical protein
MDVVPTLVDYQIFRYLSLSVERSTIGIFHSFLNCMYAQTLTTLNAFGILCVCVCVCVCVSLSIHFGHGYTHNPSY